MSQNIPDIHSHFSFFSKKNVTNTQNHWWWKQPGFHFPFFSISPLFSPSFSPLFLLSFTGWGSFPLRAQPSSDDSCKFCWVPSSKTWAVWHYPPHRAPWPREGPELSGCPPFPVRLLWRTWTALWPYWKTENQLWSGEIPLKPRWSSL